jgi:hypothetical protein
MAGIVPHFQSRHFVAIPLIAFLAMLFRVNSEGPQAETTYYPSRDNWARKASRPRHGRELAGASRRMGAETGD